MNRNKNAFKHGNSTRITRSLAYRSWDSMIQRCLNPKAVNYRIYGGRGIKVCKRWRIFFAAFLNDMGERPFSTSLDRINNNKNYTPNNCRWATRVQQRSNRNLK